MNDSAMIEKFDTWITPLFLSTFPDHELLKTQLIQSVYDSRNNAAELIASGVATTAKKSLYESSLDFLDNSEGCVESLRQFFEELVLMCAYEANQNVWPDDPQVKAVITESWCHITENGGYHDVHSHPNCSWCGIYYLDAGESSLADVNGVNRFYDPRINAEHYLDAGSSYLNAEGVWDISPVDGQVVIFPSYLKHSALPYFGKRDRVVIAFNCQVQFIE